MLFRSRLCTWRSARASALTTEIEIGVSCRLVSRLVAVTTMSSRPAGSALATVAPDGLPAYVPETDPTPLRGGFIYLSVVALICGTIVISALNLGARWNEAIVKIPLLIGSVPLFITMGEAALRIARSVRAWWPIDRGRALFRATWVAMIAALASAVAVALWLALSA